MSATDKPQTVEAAKHKRQSGKAQPTTDKAANTMPTKHRPTNRKGHKDKPLKHKALK